MARLYLFAPRNLVRDAWEALLVPSGHAVVGADGDPAVAATELRDLDVDLLLVELRWGCAPAHQLLSALEASATELRAVLLLPEGSTEPVGLRQLPVRLAWAWLSPHASVAEAMQLLAGAMAGQRQRPPWLRPGGGALPALSALERRVLHEAAMGRSATTIGQALGMSARAISDCRRQAMNRLGLADAATLARFALRQGWVDQQA